MAPTTKPRGKKRGAAKDETQQLEEEAMAEWISRGLDIADFTMDKMLALWVEEDGDSEDEEDKLSAKQELLQSLNVLGPLVEEAKERLQEFKQIAKEEAIQALKTAWKYAELPPLKRRRLLREHVQHVLQMDRESHKYEVIKQRVLDDWNIAQEAEKELVG
ncbi:hypothetical protein PINS_up000388 [Pythium insidiosum]|nr:hypothetical protein PINS_up000388 [Pythium insidiosum]